MGKTIIVSSHILPEMADICNKVGIIDRGILSVNAEVSEVMKQVRQRTVLFIAVRDGLEKAAQFLETQPLVDSLSIQAVPNQIPQIVATLKTGVEDYSELPSLLIQEGYKLTLFREEEINLESAFMALTKGTGSKI